MEKKKTPRDNVQKTLQSIIPRVTVQIYLWFVVLTLYVCSSDSFGLVGSVPTSSVKPASVMETARVPVQGMLWYWCHNWKMGYV